jgi:hypothetical protein
MLDLDDMLRGLVSIGRRFVSALLRRVWTSGERRA